MRSLPQLPNDYFEKFTDKKVRIKPFNPKLKTIAEEYINILKLVLIGQSVEIAHRGSTYFEIAGKGEIEIGVYPQNNEWSKVIEILKKKYGQTKNSEENYVRFNDIYCGVEIEIILMKGYEAEVDKKLTRYLISHPDLLAKYEKIKYKNSHSKKNYMIAKDMFFSEVVKIIPE